MPGESPLGAVSTSIAELAQRVRIEAFKTIYKGEAPSEQELARRLGVAAEEAGTALSVLVDRGLATMNERGLVTGSHGLSLVPTGHRLTFDIGDRYVWCAVDAVGIPAAMGVDAKVTSRCLQCRTPLTLTLKGGEPQGPAADALRIGIGQSGCSGKAVEDLCPVINFFCSQEHADAWAARAGGGNIINVQQAVEIGRRQWADVAEGLEVR